jgi:hypothetical protein
MTTFTTEASTTAPVVNTAETATTAVVTGAVAAVTTETKKEK